MEGKAGVTLPELGLPRSEWQDSTHACWLGIQLKEQMQKKESIRSFHFHRVNFLEAGGYSGSHPDDALCLRELKGSG